MSEIVAPGIESAWRVEDVVAEGAGGAAEGTEDSAEGTEGSDG